MSTPLRRSAGVDPHGDARVALLAKLIDHAPLFPPASLPLPEALEEDARARESRDSFLLGRFVCPAPRLCELPDVGRGISVVLDAVLADDSRVEAAETHPHFDPGAGTPDVGEVYVETPLDDALEERLDHIAELAAVVFGDEERSLAETDPAAFELDAEGFSWRGRSASAGELVSARRKRLHSIGSCSFFEPVEELEALGLLPR